MRINFINSLALTLCSTLLFASRATALNFEVDKGKSSIGFKAKATGHSFGGHLKDYEIKATGDEATHKPTALTLSWKFKDLDTENEDRDTQMIEWLGGGKPMGTFEFKKVSSEKGTDWVDGTLTIHGVTKNIHFPVVIKVAGTDVTVTGKVTINTKDFDLPIIRSMLVMTVDPELTVNFKLVGKGK